MESRNVLQEIAGEFGWGSEEDLGAGLCGAEQTGQGIRIYGTTRWPRGVQLEYFRDNCKGQKRLVAYFPDNEPWLIRLNISMESEYLWPDECGKDFDLRDPDSISRLRDWLEEYSRPPLTVWQHLKKWLDGGW